MLTKDFDISFESNFVILSKSCILYANNVATIVASYNLLNPAAIWSLNTSVSYLFCATSLSLFIFPFSLAINLSVSSSTIVLFKSFCELASETGYIYIDVFTSPNIYKFLNNSGNIQDLGRPAT